MNPASGEYVFGYPLVNKATILMPNKKKLRIRVNKLIEKNDKGIESVLLNGKSIPVVSIGHQQLLQGGKLVYNVY
jgi:putative alpha-1,2-mannosidase